MTAAPVGLSLQQGMLHSRMTYHDLWLRQLSLTGAAGELEVEAYVLGLLDPDDHQHNLIAQAMNEHFMDHGGNHPVSYHDTPPTS